MLGTSSRPDFSFHKLFSEETFSQGVEVVVRISDTTVLARRVNLLKKIVR